MVATFLIFTNKTSCKLKLFCRTFNQEKLTSLKALYFPLLAASSASPPCCKLQAQFLDSFSLSQICFLSFHSFFSQTLGLLLSLKIFSQMLLCSFKCFGSVFAWVVDDFHSLLKVWEGGSIYRVKMG